MYNFSKPTEGVDIGLTPSRLLVEAVMKTLSPDTHPEAERVQIELLRQMPRWRKLQLIGEMTRTCQVPE